jgi:hypothetical protein
MVCLFLWVARLAVGLAVRLVLNWVVHFADPGSVYVFGTAASPEAN